MCQAFYIDIAINQIHKGEYKPKTEYQHDNLLFCKFNRPILDLNLQFFLLVLVRDDLCASISTFIVRMHSLKQSKHNINRTFEHFEI